MVEGGVLDGVVAGEGVGGDSGAALWKVGGRRAGGGVEVGVFEGGAVGVVDWGGRGGGKEKDGGAAEGVAEPGGGVVEEDGEGEGAG